MVGGIFGNMMGYGMNYGATEHNYELNELAAQNADKRTRALYNDIYSPKALAEQYEKAGLSPSLMFGGTPGQGGMAGAQGGGPSGPTPQTYGTNLLEMVQAANIAADTKLKEAQAKRTSGQGPMGEAELTEILSRAGLNEAKTALTNLEGQMQSIENYVAEASKDYNIVKLAEDAKKAAADADIAFWGAKQAKLQFDFESETYQTHVAEAKERYNNLMLDSILKEAQTELTNEQKTAIREHLDQVWVQLKQEAEKIAISSKNQKAQEKFWNDSIENQKEQIRQALKIAGINAGTSAFGSLLNLGGHVAGAMVMKGLLFKGAAGVAPVIGSKALLNMSMPYGMGGGYYGAGQY